MSLIITNKHPPPHPTTPCIIPLKAHARSQLLAISDGPSNATLTSSNVTDVTSLVTLTCTSSEAHPSAGFTWSIACETVSSSQQASVCSVRPELVEGGEEVECLAFNEALPELSATALYKFPVTTSKCDGVVLLSLTVSPRSRNSVNPELFAGSNDSQ